VTESLEDTRDDDSRDDELLTDDSAADSVASGDSVDHSTSDATVEPEAEGVAVASWGARAGAFSIDVLLGGGVVLVFLFTAWSSPLFGWLWWLSIIVGALFFLAILANRVVLPVVTGSSLGRSLYGVTVVRRDGRPLDPWLLLLRDFAHILDTIPALLGWFWPLWDSRGRTFADIVARTEARPVQAPLTLERRQLALRVVAGLTGVALAGSLLGFYGVFRADKNADRARSEIAEQGPRIVPDVLSYSAGSLDADFKAAQALVTDDYRTQLVAQQDAVRKATPVVDNSYWVTNSAVLPGVTAEHAQMLLFMQGQRGQAPKQRFITATVRASFVKVKGQWQLSDLNVLTKPVAPQAAPPVPAPAKSDAKPGDASSVKPSAATPTESKPTESKPTDKPNPPKQGR